MGGDGDLSGRRALVLARPHKPWDGGSIRILVSASRAYSWPAEPTAVAAAAACLLWQPGWVGDGWGAPLSWPVRKPYGHCIRPIDSHRVGLDRRLSQALSFSHGQTAVA